MPNTPGYGWPYPGTNDEPAHASDMQNLAEAIEDTTEGIDANLASAQAQLDALEAQALVVLASVQEDSPVSNIEFTDIDQDYDHLVCYWRGDGESGTGYSSLNIRFNSDDSEDGYTSERISFATSDGPWNQELVFGSTVGNTFFTVMRVGMVGGAAGSTGMFYIPFYSVASFIKSASGSSTALRTTGGDVRPTVAQAGGRWLSANDAITSIWMSPGGNQWDRIRAHLIGIRSGT